MNRKIKDNIDSYGSLDGKGATLKNNTPNNTTRKYQSDELKSFAEIWTNQDFEPTELLSDYLYTDLVINHFTTGEGKYGPYVLLNAFVNGNKKLLRTSSSVIFKQLARTGDKLPYKTRVIVKDNAIGKKYLRLS